MKKYTILFSLMLGFNLCLGVTSGFAMAGAVVTAVIKPTQAGSLISGTATFEEAPDGLMIKVEIKGAPAGTHGIHIHEKGRCEDQGNAAGGHFNPDHAVHGDLMNSGFSKAHAGDLGNIQIDANGNGTLVKTIPGLTLTKGKYAVAGRSLILHAKEDDFGQPTGNAGGRIACALI